MTQTRTPRIPAAVVAAAATRLAGTIVLDVADWTVGPAVYVARLEVFRTLEGEDLGVDDGTLIVLVAPGVAMDLVHEHGTPGRAAEALNRAQRAEDGAA